MLIHYPKIPFIEINSLYTMYITMFYNLMTTVCYNWLLYPYLYSENKGAVFIASTLCVTNFDSNEAIYFITSFQYVFK